MAVVVANLAEWPLPIPEIHGSNPVIVIRTYILLTIEITVEKDENKPKIDREWAILQNMLTLVNKGSLVSIKKEPFFLSEPTMPFVHLPQHVLTYLGMLRPSKKNSPNLLPKLSRSLKK